MSGQYHARLGRRHDAVIGAGYRLLNENIDGGFAFSIAPKQVTDQKVNAFAQDEIAIKTVHLTLGAKHF